MTNTIFLNEFPDLLHLFTDFRSDLVLLCGFNCQIVSDYQVNRLKTILADHNLTQFVDVPTQKCGHILDWAVVNSTASCMKLERVEALPGLSDHCSTFCTMSFRRPCRKRRAVTPLNIKAMSMPDSQPDTRGLADRAVECTDADLVNFYNSGLHPTTTPLWSPGQSDVR